MLNKACLYLTLLFLLEDPFLVFWCMCVCGGKGGGRERWLDGTAEKIEDSRKSHACQQESHVSQIF